MTAEIDKYENQDFIANLVHQQKIAFYVAFPITLCIAGQLMVLVRCRQGFAGGKKYNSGIESYLRGGLQGPGFL